MESERMEIETMRQLIETLAAKIKANENNDFEKSPNNIFQILGIETNEVQACRFLGYILNQKAKKLGAKSPLSYFLSDVLDVSDELKDGATVVLEDVIDEGSLANSIMLYAYQNNIDINIEKRNVNNTYAPTGSIEDLDKLYKLDSENLKEFISNAYRSISSR